MSWKFFLTSFYLTFSAELEREVVAREERLKEMTEALSSLDKEQDALRSQVDSKDEAIQQLQHQLSEKVWSALSFLSRDAQFAAEVDIPGFSLLGAKHSHEEAPV